MAPVKAPEVLCDNCGKPVPPNRRESFLKTCSRRCAKEYYDGGL